MFTRVPTLHVASCSVEYSVDELHCCALSTEGLKPFHKTSKPATRLRLPCLHSLKRVEENERERARIEEKGRALQTLKELVMDSSLIDESVKEQRFTEEYTPSN